MRRTGHEAGRGKPEARPNTINHQNMNCLISLRRCSAARAGCGLSWRRLALLAVGGLGVVLARADTIPATVLDDNLQVTPFLSSLNQPIGIVFLGADDAFDYAQALEQTKRAADAARWYEALLKKTEKAAEGADFRREIAQDRLKRLK